MNDGRKPDRVELGIRFGCGAFAGFLFAFFLAIRLADGMAGPLGIAVVAAIGIGVLATVYGDRFWYSFLKMFWWSWW